MTTFLLVVLVACAIVCELLAVIGSRAKIRTAATLGYAFSVFALGLWFFWYTVVGGIALLVLGAAGLFLFPWVHRQKETAKEARRGKEGPDRR